MIRTKNVHTAMLASCRIDLVVVAANGSPFPALIQATDAGTKEAHVSVDGPPAGDPRGSTGRLVHQVHATHGGRRRLVPVVDADAQMCRRLWSIGGVVRLPRRAARVEDVESVTKQSGAGRPKVDRP